MLIEEVIERLNEGQKLEELAEQLGMSPTQLKLKLTNAAVEYDEKSFEWVYRGIVKEKSLTRDITKTIKRLKEDKPYIKALLKLVVDN
ncbi:helix-turn-helix transcriptional regulator [Bacillus xiapuensis]|uniref:helix-turn-helix transcriptional regulator n=1 Tax=Bacillus xiapuensis TaxID=2014075 RepID=UPI000C23FF87|nr:helix-turn-helix transcriptional regulator [Bacillus xiapuensis]